MAIITMGVLPNRFIGNDKDDIIELVENHNNTRNSPMTKNERICIEFVRMKMSSPDGAIYTNYLDDDFNKEYATGHEVLSESVGLMMLYCIGNEEKSFFSQQFDILVNCMMLQNGLIMWRVDEGANITDSSASVDDLRIARALFTAYEIWGEKAYLDYALKIESALFDNSTYNGNLVSHYSQNGGLAAKDIELCYLDFKTMQLMSKYNEEWLEIMNEGLEAVENGLISSEFPMYKKNYDIESGLYSNTQVINILDSLSTILHLSEVGQEDKRSIEWIKRQLKDGNALFSKYSNKGERLSEIESTAVYAIVSRIAKNIGDKDLYSESLARMNQFQIKDSESKIYGSFGYEDKLEVFSYDNLQALLSY